MNIAGIMVAVIAAWPRAEISDFACLTAIPYAAHVHSLTGDQDTIFRSW